MLIPYSTAIGKKYQIFSCLITHYHVHALIRHLFYRILATRHRLVQHIHLMRRTRLLLQYHAHVLYQPWSLLRHQESVENPTHVLDEASSRHKNRHSMGAFLTGFRFSHRIG